MHVNLLKKYLKDHHMSMDTFSYILGVTKTSVSFWVTRRATPRPKMALKIERATKGSVKISFWGYKKDTRGKLFAISTYTRKKRAKDGGE
jgi:hypothetical protein